MKKFILYISFLTLNFSLVLADWVQVSNGITQLNINALTSYTSGGVNYIFAGSLGTYTGSGIFLTSNNGDSWSLCLNLINNDVWTLANTNSGGITYIYDGTSGGLGRSTNNGANWVSLIFPIQGHWFYSVAASGNYVYAGTRWLSNDSGGVYRSTNYGTNWIKTSIPAQPYQDVDGLLINGNNVYAGGSIGIWVSTDYGINWIQSPNGPGSLSFAVNGNYIFTGGFAYGVQVSTDNGINWTQTSLNYGGINALSNYNNNIFAGGGDGSGHCFWVSTNNGLTWVFRNENMNYYVNALCISNGYIFAGTDGHGVFRRPLDELIGIKKISHEIPSVFCLYQNYPNPFNPSTKIKFSIPLLPLAKGAGGMDHVALKIYDILGREVTSLVNQRLKPGTYEVDWNASNYTTGVYFYQLIADGKIIDTKKLIVLK